MLAIKGRGRGVVWFIFISFTAFTEQRRVEDLWARRTRRCWRDAAGTEPRAGAAPLLPCRAKKCTIISKATITAYSQRTREQAPKRFVLAQEAKKGHRRENPDRTF